MRLVREAERRKEGNAQSRLDSRCRSDNAGSAGSREWMRQSVCCLALVDEMIRTQCLAAQSRATRTTLLGRCVPLASGRQRDSRVESSAADPPVRLTAVVRLALPAAPNARTRLTA